MYKFLILILLFTNYAYSQFNITKIKPLIKNGSLVITQNKKILVNINGKKFYTPASILKIITSQYFLEVLGDDFKFPIDIYYYKNDLYIKGYGNPLFISEEINKLTKIIKTKKIKINNLYLDNTFFEKNIKIPGVTKTLNPYDSQNNALCSNFNTVYIKKNKNGEIFSAEKQTPLTPISKVLGLKLTNNTKDRFNIGALTNNNDVFTLYSGELIKEFLKKQKVIITGNIKLKKINLNKKYKLFTFYSSFTLKEIIKKLLKYSNNFIANQIGLYIGGTKYYEPANIKKSIEYFNKYIINKKPYLKTAEIFEFSGISHKNKITAFQMNTALTHFFKYKNLLNNKNNLFFKTGSLKKVHTLAGYYKVNNKYYQIVLLLNQKENNRKKIINIIKNELNKL